jgi:hypothetical protein
MGPKRFPAARRMYFVFNSVGMSINLGGGGMGGMGGMGGGFNNRWGSSCPSYNTMPGYSFVDYSNGWNPNYHDQLLRNNIDIVYQRYDRNFSGQLEGNEFFYAYRDLCLMMGIAPPMDYQSVWNAVLQCDSNFNGRVSKMEMFMMFKRIQGFQMGYGF